MAVLVGLLAPDVRERAGVTVGGDDVAIVADEDDESLPLFKRAAIDAARTGLLNFLAPEEVEASAGGVDDPAVL